MATKKATKKATISAAVAGAQMDAQNAGSYEAGKASIPGCTHFVPIAAADQAEDKITVDHVVPDNAA